ncbi:MAG: hypothetical protein ACP5E3_20725 [Bacteroidales bacterium]
MNISGLIWKNALRPSLLVFLFIPLFLNYGCTDNNRKSRSKKEKIAYEKYKDGSIKTESQVKEGKAHGLLKNYTPGGLLESVYTYNMGVKDGPAVVYYPNGQPRAKMYYKENYRHGITRQYYRSGELYRESPYENGKLNGIRKTLYKDGTLMAEAPFMDGYAGLGLKEYDKDGALLDNKPRLVITPINKLAMEDKYVLRLKLEPSMPGTIFYIGDLKEDRFIHVGLWPLEPSNGIAEYTIKVRKGSFRMEVMTITAQYKTDKSNYGVISRKYNLAIDNK